MLEPNDSREQTCNGFFGRFFGFLFSGARSSAAGHGPQAWQSEILPLQIIRICLLRLNHLMELELTNSTGVSGKALPGQT